jgi:hypothetical protein
MTKFNRTFWLHSEDFPKIDTTRLLKLAEIFEVAAEELLGSSDKHSEFHNNQIQNGTGFVEYFYEASRETCELHTPTPKNPRNPCHPQNPRFHFLCLHRGSSGLWDFADSAWLHPHPKIRAIRGIRSIRVSTSFVFCSTLKLTLTYSKNKM